MDFRDDIRALRGALGIGYGLNVCVYATDLKRDPNLESCPYLNVRSGAWGLGA